MSFIFKMIENYKCLDKAFLIYKKQLFLVLANKKYSNHLSGRITQKKAWGSSPSAIACNTFLRILLIKLMLAF